MWNDFKQFINRGNVLDLAVGVIIGSAFSKIVTSLVADLLTPVLGLILGKINVSALAITAGNATIKYGAFLQSVIDFLITSFSIFLMIYLLNNRRKITEKVLRIEKQPEHPGEEEIPDEQAEKEAAKIPSAEEALLMEIRDLLKQNLAKDTRTAQN